MNKWDTIQSDVADAYVHLNEEMEFDSDNDDIEFSLDEWDEM
jgi:hypothetical protein